MSAEAELGLGRSALLALVISVIFKTTDWKKILGALLTESGAAMWLA